MKWATEWIAIFYTIGYFAMVGVIMLWPNVNEPPSSLLGIMSAAQLAIIQYYFGASKQQHNGGTTHVTASDSATSVASPPKAP